MSIVNVAKCLSVLYRRDIEGVYLGTEAATRFVIGVGMLTVGTLLATVWSDVRGRELVAVNVAPGEARVSRSFSW